MENNKHPLIVIKIGGNIIDNEIALRTFLTDIATIPHKGILIHGGGKMATKLADRMGIEQQLVDGRRITDAKTLEIVTMVYAGLINKTIVAQLQSLSCNAIGLSGADGNLIQAHKRKPVEDKQGIESIDFGFAGDVDIVNSSLLQDLLRLGHFPVISPITHDKKGQLLNTNADTIAQEIAKSMSPHFETHLVYCFEKNGVLMDAADDSSVIPQINSAYYETLKSQGVVSGGMLPKLENAFKALRYGVKKVSIGHAAQIKQIVNGVGGTTLTEN